MKTLLITVALVLAVIPASAAVQFDFVQKQSSDDSASPSSDLTARATIDGNRSRVDFLSGTMYPPGTYVVSTDRLRRLFFVDPDNKWFTEVNTGGIASALGASNIRIENLKTEVVRLDDRPRIAGIETEHQRLSVSYDITVSMRGIPLKQRVRTDIDSWTTMQFAHLQHDAFSTGLRTGNAEIDRLLEAESTKITGFPLRQIVTVRTNFEAKNRSKIELPTSRTITRETVITGVREIPLAAASLFTVPETYRRADQPDLPRSAAQVLTFEPAGGN